MLGEKPVGLQPIIELIVMGPRVRVFMPFESILCIKRV